MKGNPKFHHPKKKQKGSQTPENRREKKKKKKRGRRKKRSGNVLITDALSADGTTIGARDGAILLVGTAESHGAKTGDTMDGDVAVNDSTDSATDGLGKVVEGEGASRSLNAGLSRKKDNQRKGDE